MWLILGAGVLWGTTGTAQALGPPDAAPVAVGVVRLLLAGPVLAALALMRRVRLPALRSHRGATLAAATGMALYQPAFFSAVDRTGVALGTVVAIGSAPVLTGLIGWMVENVRPTPRWAVATGLAVGGVGLIAGSGQQLGADPIGVALALVAGASYAVYVVASVHLVRDGSAVGAMAMVFLLAAALSLPAVAFVDVAWVASIRGAAMALHLGVVTTALAYLLFGRGLRTTAPADAATLTLAEPVTATLLGVVVLAERPALVAWLGVAVVMVGLTFAVRAAASPLRLADGVDQRRSAA